MTGPGGSKRRVYLAKWKSGGKVREKAFAIKRDAKSYAAEMQANYENKPLSAVEHYQRSTVVLEDLATQYFEALRTGTGEQERLEDRTIRGYDRQYRKFIQPYFDVVGGTIASIGRNDILAIKEQTLLKSKSTRQARDAVRLMRAMLKYAVSRGLIDEVVGSDIRVRLSRYEKTASRIRQTDGVFTPSQVNAILDATDRLCASRQETTRNWILYRGLIYFLAFTGVRISEARGFPRTSYDTLQGLILIRQRADDNGKIGLTKSSDGIRNIPLHDRLREPMEAALENHDRDLVFSTRTGKPFGYSNLYHRMWASILAEANAEAGVGGGCHVPELGFHALRHSFASRLIAAGANLKQLQTWMGHNDPAFTMRVYGHLFVDDGSAAAILARI